MATMYAPSSTVNYFQQANLNQHQPSTISASNNTSAPHDTSRRMSYSAQSGLMQEANGEEELEPYTEEGQSTMDSEMEDGAAQDQLETSSVCTVPDSTIDTSSTASTMTASTKQLTHSSTASSSTQNLTPEEAELIRQTEMILGVDWELHQDIFMNLQRNEKKYRVYNDQSKYLKHRRIIVDWMCEVGEEYKIGPLTIHSAVRYLDRTLSTSEVAKNRLQLVAMACILIAAKYEEAEESIPSMVDLNECSNNAYTLDSLKDMEVAILRHLQWCLASVTPVHFLHFYQARGIVFQNDLFEGGPGNRKSALKYVKKYADFFAELCLQEYSFQQYLPSVMAAAVIAAARRAVKIDPIWNPELEGLTTYNERQIFKSYKHLYNYYIVSFPTTPHVQNMVSPRSVLEFEAKGQQQA